MFRFVIMCIFIIFSSKIKESVLVPALWCVKDIAMSQDYLRIFITCTSKENSLYNRSSI